MDPRYRGCKKRFHRIYFRHRGETIPGSPHQNKIRKPTLNLSQYQEESADWMNLSKERIVDTQAEIEKLLGMDSMTFRSCALIMQDQYGLFLQAKKDERMCNWPISHQKDLLMIILSNPPTDWQRSI